MYIKVKVHPSSKENEIIKKNEDSFEIFVRAKPVDGKANEAVMDLLAEFLKVPRSKVRLLKGSLTRNKIVELLK
ncbi:MAG: DUF167 domain-containing protein [Candidatus Kryptoniota bacterium]